MSTSEKCMKCDGTPLRTGECNPMCCTTVFSIDKYPILNADIVVTANSLRIPLDALKVKCPKCGCEFHHY